MSDPVPASLRPRPRRAEPLQPDRPWHEPAAEAGEAVEAGETVAPDPAVADAQTPAGPAAPAAPDQQAVAREKKRSETALRNVRQGYD